MKTWPSKLTESRQLIRDLILLRTKVRLDCGFPWRTDWNSYCCSPVSEKVEAEYGWESVEGTYETNEIEEYHWWNILPDGRILDVTVDQFREGEEVRVTERDDWRYTEIGE